jgi:hypothetical protein
MKGHILGNTESERQLEQGLSAVAYLLPQLNSATGWGAPQARRKRRGNGCAARQCVQAPACVFPAGRQDSFFRMPER